MTTRSGQEVMMKTTTVSFELASGLIVVKVRVNGIPQRFVVDTGASHTILTARAVTTLALESHPALGSTVVGAKGSTSATPVTVPSFVWGDVELSDLTLMQVAMEHVCGMTGNDVAGVIGYDVLSRFRFTVDYRQRQLVLEPVGLDVPTAPRRSEIIDDG